MTQQQLPNMSNEAADAPQSPAHTEETTAQTPNEIVSATDFARSVQESDPVFERAKCAFVDKPVFYEFDILQSRPVALDNIKVDVDGWKMSFKPDGSDGLFKFIKEFQDPEVTLFRNPKPLPKLLWKDSSKDDLELRPLSSLMGFRLARLNRYGGYLSEMFLADSLIQGFRWGLFLWMQRELTGTTTNRPSSRPVLWSP